MPIGALVGGALGLAGSLFSSSRQRRHNEQMQSSAQQFSYEGQKREHAHSKSMFGKSSAHASQMQERDIEHQRHMAQHGMQYKVNDMRAAGLNPMLAAGFGAGGSAGGQAAPAPGGSAPSPGGTPADLGDPAHSALSAYQGLASINNQTNQSNSQVALNSAYAAESASRAALNQDKISANFYGSSAKELNARTAFQDRARQSMDYADRYTSQAAGLIEQRIVALKLEIEDMREGPDLRRAQIQLMNEQSNLTRINATREQIALGMARWQVVQAEFDARQSEASYRHPSPGFGITSGAVRYATDALRNIRSSAEQTSQQMYYNLRNRSHHESGRGS